MYNKNKELAYDAYQQTNDFWMNLHLKTLYISTLVTFLVEILMFFIICYIDDMSSSIGVYLWKYTIIPTGACLILCFIGHYCIQNQDMTSRKKQYIISLLTVCMAFIISIVHNIFVAVLIVLSIPSLLSVLYEDETLTSVVTITSVICQFLSGFVIIWDQDKVLDSLYIINLLVIFVMAFIIWIISCTMIRFIKKKRDLIIKNECERYELKRKVRIDSLTSIGNKMALKKELQQQVESGKECYLVMFDIDKFKDINDQYGHVFGDNVLKAIGSLLLEIVPKNSAYRYGGDEFCVFLNESQENAQLLIWQLQALLKQDNQYYEPFVPITISAGIAKYEPKMTQEEWIMKADRALYKAKSVGGDMLVFG